MSLLSKTRELNTLLQKHKGIALYLYAFVTVYLILLFLIINSFCLSFIFGFILEKMLEDLSYEAPNMPNAVVDITPQYVDDKLKSISTNKDLSAFIL